MKPEFEYRDCVQCEANYLDQCKHIVVVIGGKPELPDVCWRRDRVKLMPEPHNQEQRV